MNKNIFININGIDNKSISIPLEKLSHTIIFGATGSGKSNLLHMLITNLANTYSPEELKLALIDPKYVEFEMYKSLPHIFPRGIIKSPSEILHLLDYWIVNKIDNNDNTPLIIIIDELAELSFNKTILLKLSSIINKGAKHNIFLIMASQRPDLIPEEIINKTKAQICFPIDSDRLPKTLANNLKTTQIKNHGEMIFSNSNKTKYMQTEYITPTIISGIVSKFKN